MIQRILVPVDGSESADKALDFAIDLAERYSASILLLSVVPSMVIPLILEPSPGVMTIPPEAMLSYEKEVESRYERVLSKAQKKTRKSKAHLEVQKKLVKGQPADMIVETAREGNFDLIIIGSHGLSGIKEFFLGSVSNRVAHQASCPVLIVK